MFAELHTLQFSEEEAKIFWLHVARDNEGEGLEDTGFVCFMLLGGDMPHLAQLFLLDLLVFVEEFKEIEAFLDYFGIEGWTEEYIEDILFNKPLFELIFFEPSIRYFHLGVRTWNARCHLFYNHARTGELLL